MKTRIIVEFLLVFSIIPRIIATDFDRKEILNGLIDSNEVGEYTSETSDDGNLVMNDNDRHESSEMPINFIRSDDNLANDSKIIENSDTMDDGNRTILKFGKRVFESIEKYGIMDNDVRRLNAGKFEIDWWKKSRRLERMRERLFDEIVSNRELNIRLHSLGWQDNSKINYQSKKNDDRDSVSSQNSKPRNLVLYGILVIGYLPEGREAGNPVKFHLITYNQTDSGANASDVEVIALMSKEMKALSDGKPSDVENPNGQVMDRDRILQLIPLVVEELRRGRISAKENRSLRRIFGKRLWLLLEREASKNSNETMDHALATFIFNGKLAERDANRTGRRRYRIVNDQRQEQNFSNHADNKNRGNHQRCNKNHHYENYNDNYNRTNDRRPSRKFHEEKDKNKT